MLRRVSAVVALGLLGGLPGAATAQYVFTPYDAPCSTRTAVNGNSPPAIAGEFDDEDGATHGFVLTNKGFTQIDHPDADGYTTVNGINAAGQLSGTYNDGTRFFAFFWSKGQFTTLDPPGAIRSVGSFINAQGQVVGTYRTADNTRHAFVWSKGKFTTIDHPDAAAPGGTSGVGINDVGEVVGTFVDADGARHGFVLSGGKFTTLDAPGADDFTVAQGINNAGQIVGQYTDADGNGHGFVLIKGVYTTVDVDGPLSQTAVFSINAKGEITGQFDDEDGNTHGFVGVPAR